MATRSTVGTYKLKVNIASKEPISVHDALQDDCWKVAMQDELKTLHKIGTWTLVDLPQNRKPIGSWWLFKTKENPNGSILKRKARLAAQGFKQKSGLDYTETFIPVIKSSIIRVILTLYSYFSGLAYKASRC
ncbi:uncharacterized mitochondrial protein AtMg00820-like [Humulus lupulus]|uniref:uncharacterized mitochondrial protein AtMg00820-like n=1 Tax=Humulus lupulus TaxID=3486 RepID=UPI002B40AED3|nr:uncharacterized mitochondrial protein AtMg00820-like [Humulus lupulus]